MIDQCLLKIPFTLLRRLNGNFGNKIWQEAGTIIETIHLVTSHKAKLPSLIKLIREPSGPQTGEVFQF
jgi:hypothetical protein